MLPEQLERQLRSLAAELPPPDLSQRIQQAVNIERARQAALAHWRRVLSTSLGAFAAVLLVVWAGLETLAAWQVGAVGDFADLFTGHPDLVIQYPGEALNALLESLPIANMLLLLGAVLVVILLIGQLQHALQNDERGKLLYR